MTASFSKRELLSKKLKPSNLIWLSTVLFHSSFTSAFAETIKTILASISTAQHIEVNDFPNRITAYIKRFVFPFSYVYLNLYLFFFFFFFCFIFFFFLSF